MRSSAGPEGTASGWATLVDLPAEGLREAHEGNLALALGDS